MKPKSIKANAVLNIIYTISNIIFPLITFPYASRILLADGMGKVSFFTAVSNYAVMIAALGISTYGIRATAKVRNNKEELSKVTAELLTINLIGTVIVIIVLIASIPFVNKFRNDKILLLINCCFIFSAALGMNWLYSGLEQYSYITKRSIIFKLISLVLVFLLVRDHADYNIYAAITVLSTAGSYLLNFWYSKKFVSFRNIKKLNFKKHFKPMLLLFASVLAVNIYTNLDTVMLGFISGDREVGLYTVAVKVKGLLLSVVNAISAVLLPRLSYYLSANKKEEYNRILKKSTSIIFMIAIPLTAFFIIEAKDSILLLGGEDYLDATLCMQIVIPILIISGISNITGNQILIPMGKDSCFMKAVIIGSIVDLILNALLMPKLASIGAAIATLLAESIQMSIQLMYSWQYVNKSIQRKSLLKIIISTFIASVTITFLKSIFLTEHSVTTFNSFVNLTIYAGVYFSVYGIVLLIVREKYCREMVQLCLTKVSKKRIYK